MNLGASDAITAAIAAILSAVAAWIGASSRLRRKLVGLDAAAEEHEREAWRALWRSEVDRVVEQLQSVTAHRDELLARQAELLARVEILTREVEDLRAWRRTVESRTPTMSPRSVGGDEWRSGGDG